MIVGEKIGPFAVDKELGSGAMGTVYRAKDEKSGKRVAIKMMSAAVGSGDTAMARFKREATILKQLDHPNIARFIASGRFGRNPFYAMEYCEGESLDRALARRGRLTWEEVVTLGTQLCDALQHAHHKGIIHRDLKPSNVMILPNGTIKLMDFGIAKDVDVTALTAANSTVGTAAYMSPEQCRGERELTPKSDLYSLGIMFYELMTGKKPFMADSAMEIFRLHTAGPFERPSRICLDIPIWLDTLICQLMEKSPDKRPFDALAVREALTRIKDKVEAQQSAGVEAAKSRRIDRSAHQPAMDETDKEAARTLLHKKKRKKTEPFYSKGWFQALALAAVVLALGYVLYATFFKTPSADSLYAQAKTLMASGDAEQRREARRGPIEDFLRYYKDHDKATQMQNWADEVDRDRCERQLFNRRNRKLPAADDAEQLARQALDEEDLGKLADAETTWKSLQAKRTSKDPEERIWSLVADKFLGELSAVQELYQKLQITVRDDLKSKKRTEGGSEFEKLALLALRAELTGQDAGEARLHWKELQKKADDAGQRRWFLLSAKRDRELTLAPKK